MKTIVVFLALVAAVSMARPHTSAEYQAAFSDWMVQNQKSYSNVEFRLRYFIFKSNLDLIESHNAKEGESYTLAMNSLGDLTAAEFAQYYLGYNQELKPTTIFSAHQDLAASSVVRSANALPESLDWRTKGAVTPVKDQGQCGSCWAFSTTGSSEGAHFLSTGKLVSLSEQNLMDCSNSYGNQGCNGGLMTNAMQYIIKNGGVDTETSYPYTAKDGSCHFSSSNVGATLKSFTNVKQGDETDLQNKVNSGPVSVAMDASHTNFQFYSSGVYKYALCSSTRLDHGVLAVGWGHDTTGGDYWIVKNSWGTSWGQSGYFWLARNDGNMCGIATSATLPSA